MGKLFTQGKRRRERGINSSKNVSAKIEDQGLLAWNFAEPSENESTKNKQRTNLPPPVPLPPRKRMSQSPGECSGNNSAKKIDREKTASNTNSYCPRKWKRVAGPQNQGQMGERKEEKLDLDQFVNHFTAAMESGEEAPIRRAISLLGLAHQQLGVRLAIVGPELAQAIVNVPWKSDRFRWACFHQFNEALGLASTLHNQFGSFARELINILTEHTQTKTPPVSVSTELVDLVISLLHSATFLLDPAAISDLQAAVCRATASDPTPPLSVFRLLNTLLSHNHDLVPLPLQIAQSVLFRDFNEARRRDHSDWTGLRAELERGRALCSALSRPKFPAVYPAPATNFGGSGENSSQATEKSVEKCGESRQPTKSGGLRSEKVVNNSKAKGNESPMDTDLRPPQQDASTLDAAKNSAATDQNVSSICVIEREERHAAPSFLEPKKKGGNIVPQKCANNNQDEKEEEDPADLPPTAPRAPPNATFWTPQAKLRYQALMRAAAQEEAYGRQKEALCSKKIVDAAGDFVVAVTADKKAPHAKKVVVENGGNDQVEDEEEDADDIVERLFDPDDVMIIDDDEHEEEACGVDDSIIPLVGDTPEGSVVDDEEEDEEVEDEE